MILGIATMVAFVGSLAVADIKPWGTWVVVGLLGSWTVLALLSALYQDRRDRAAGRIAEQVEQTSEIARVLQAPFFLVALGCFGYAMWLEHEGAPLEVRQPFSSLAWLLMLVGWLVRLATETISFWLERRKSGLRARP